MAVSLALDVGSTKLRCLAVKEDGSVCSLHFEDIHNEYPSPGRTEIDPIRLWESCKVVIQKVVDDVAKDVGVERVRCLGITTQRSGVLLWNRATGETLCNIITWQDRRSKSVCHEWKDRWSVKLLHAGAQLAHAFTRMARFKAGSELELKYASAAPKLIWCLENIKGAKQLAEQGQLCYGGIDSWILWQLTSGRVHAMDYSQASSTNLFDPFTMDWSSFVLGIVGLPPGILPKLKDTVDDYGSCSPELFGAPIPITASIADQQSAMFAHGCWKKGEVKSTLGTGTFLALNTGNIPLAPDGGLYPMVAWKVGSEVAFMVEGNASSTGSAVEWAVRFGLIDSPEESGDVAEEVGDSGGVYFVPAFDGLQAPQWDPSASVSIIGINHKTERKHVLRALLEAFAFHLKQLHLVFQNTLQYRPDCIHCDGGVAKNEFLMRFTADLLQVRLSCPKEAEMTGLGAAYLAGLHSSAGLWEMEDIRGIIRARDSRNYSPENSAAPRVVEMQQSYRIWLQALERSLSWRAKI